MPDRISPAEERRIADGLRTAIERFEEAQRAALARLQNDLRAALWPGDKPCTVPTTVTLPCSPCELLNTLDIALQQVDGVKEILTRLYDDAPDCGVRNG